MIKCKQITLLRGNKTLLNQANLTLFHGQKIGLVGANGAGKSSVFALFRGELQQEAGSLEMPNNVTIAHVAQETPALNTSALDYALDGDSELRQLEKALLQEHDGLTHADLLIRYEDIGGYTAISRASKLLSGLGFSNAEIDQPVSSFSGGWRMRLNLAQALMCRSDILLLDEPTNHLDLETVMWLENFLRSYQGMLILISHDRDFLDSTVEHIVHLEAGAFTLYTGNYSAYEIQKTEKMLMHQAAYEKQQQQIAHLNSYITRFRAKATKAKQAQSRIKALERMDKIAALHAHSPFQFSFLKPESSPNPLLRLDEGSFTYNLDTSPILSNLNVTIEKGARLGLLGPNGAGKSTFIKLLANIHTLQTGQRIEGKGLAIGYFAQHQLEALRAEYSPLWHMRQLDPKTPEQVHRNFLGGFNFHGDMASSAVMHFSGGEKARLSLALLIWQKPNLLLLDEPTNHLDLEMRDALTLALQDYEGALIVVSHDRHFLRVITDTFWLIDKGRVQVFEGDLDDYRRYVEIEKSEMRTVLSKSTQLTDRKEEKRLQAQERERIHALKKPLQQKLHKLEIQMQTLQEKKRQVEEKLADTTLYAEEKKAQLQQLLNQASDIQVQLEENEETWLLLHDELEQMGK
jgi:ATP-binding cassette subfamily F protein 3